MRLKGTHVALGLLALILLRSNDAGGGVHSWDKKRLTKAQLRDLAGRAGFPDPNLAAAIAMAESGGNPDAVGDSGVSIGLWQVNTSAHPNWTKADLHDPEHNANAAYAISAGGSDWSPWTVYKTGAYKRFL